VRKFNSELFFYIRRESISNTHLRFTTTPPMVVHTVFKSNYRGLRFVVKIHNNNNDDNNNDDNNNNNINNDNVNNNNNNNNNN